MTEKLSDERLAELRDIAGAAMPGKWVGVTDDSRCEERVMRVADLSMTVAWAGEIEDEWSAFNADHIAAFDPPTVLALLDELAEYRARDAETAARRRIEQGG